MTAPRVLSEEEFAKLLADADWSSVGRRRHHRRAGLRTPDVPYRAYAGLLADIAARGAVVSESPPGRPLSRMRFLGRNRIIAASLGFNVT